MIYFVSDGEFVKIGFCQGTRVDLEGRRLRVLQIGNARQLKLLAIMPGDHAMELKLHERFAEERVRGEWFKHHQRLDDFIEVVRKRYRQDGWWSTHHAEANWAAMLRRAGRLVSSG